MGNRRRQFTTTHVSVSLRAPQLSPVYVPCYACLWLWSYRSHVKLMMMAMPLRSCVVRVLSSAHRNEPLHYLPLARLVPCKIAGRRASATDIQSAKLLLLHRAIKVEESVISIDAS